MTKNNAYDDFFKPKKVDQDKISEKGGQGSGNWGHQGLANVWGGSSPTVNAGSGGAKPSGGSPRPAAGGGEKPSGGAREVPEWVENLPKSVRTGIVSMGQKNFGLMLDDQSQEHFHSLPEGHHGKNSIPAFIGTSLAEALDFNAKDLMGCMYMAFEDANMHSENISIKKKFPDLALGEKSDFLKFSKMGTKVSRFFLFDIGYISDVFVTGFETLDRMDVADAIREFVPDYWEK